MPVWNGAQGTVGLSLEQPLELLKPVLSATPLQFEVEYKSPISAPINKGDVIGTLIASVDGLPDIKTPLVANQDIPVGGFLSRLKTAAFVLTAKLQDRSGAAFYWLTDNLLRWRGSTVRASQRKPNCWQPLYAQTDMMSF